MSINAIGSSTKSVSDVKVCQNGVLVNVNKIVKDDVLIWGRNMDVQFVAVGPDNKAKYSYDGVAWHDCAGFTSGSWFCWCCACYANGKWIAGNSDGKLFYSTDGKSFNNVSGSYGWLNCVKYWKGKFFAYNSSGNVYSSYDGISWSEFGSGSGLSGTGINAVSFGNDICCAVGDNTIWISETGWYQFNQVEKPSGFPSSNVCIYDSYFHDGKFIIVGEYDNGLSHSFLYWIKEEDIGVSNSWSGGTIRAPGWGSTGGIYKIKYRSGRYVAASVRKILHSTTLNTLEWNLIGFTDVVSVGRSSLDIIHNGKYCILPCYQKIVRTSDYSSYKYDDADIFMITIAERNP